MMYKRERSTAAPPAHGNPNEQRRTLLGGCDRTKQVLFVATIAALASILMMVGRDDEPEHITLEGHAALENEKLIISGTTNLPDGAMVLVKIPDLEMHQFFGVALIEVHDGSFETSVVVAEDIYDALIHDLLVVKVTFEIVMEDRSQPPELIERFGAIGQRMTANDVIQAEHGKRLIWHLPIEHRN